MVTGSAEKAAFRLRALWLIVTMVLGVVFVWMMVRVYNTIDTVPTWYSVWTPMSFFLTMFIGRPLLGYLLLRVAGINGWAMRLLPAAVSLLALAVIPVPLSRSCREPELANIHSSIQQASALVPDAVQPDGLACGAADGGAGVLDCPSARLHRLRCRCIPGLYCWCWQGS